MSEAINAIEHLTGALKKAYRLIERKDEEIADLKEQLAAARKSAIRKYEYQKIGA